MNASILIKVQTQQIKKDNRNNINKNQNKSINNQKIDNSRQNNSQVLSKNQNYIKIDYSQKDYLIYNLFKDDQNYYQDFYVDIGIKNPYFESKTHQLFVRGSKGLQLDYKFQNINKFYYLRPQTITLNMAINNQNHYLDKYNIPTTSLKDLCQRYYSKKPTFMAINIDQQHQTVQNLQKSLESNNWNNKTCRPQLLMIQFSKKSQILNNQRLYEKLLEKNNYEKFFQDNSSSIWIEKINMQVFKRISKVNQQLLNKNLKRIKYQNLMIEINHFILGQFSLNDQDFQSYDSLNNSLYIHFSKPGVPIIIQKINLLSNQSLLTQQQQQSRINRPILILQYNPLNTDLIINQDAYYLSDLYLEYNQNITLHLWKLEMTKINQKKEYQGNYEVFILDHQYLQLQSNSQKQLDVFINPTANSKLNQSNQIRKQKQAKKQKLKVQKKLIVQKLSFGKQLAFKTLIGIMLVVLIIFLKLKKKKLEMMIKLKDSNIKLSEVTLDQIQSRQSIK